MKIQAVSATPDLHAARAPKQWDATTLKTHAVVVLSYLLIGVGIFLACASLYMATMIPPMLAVALPALPLAAGVIVRPSSSTGLLSVSSAPVHLPGQPLGMGNEDGATCWLNSALQLCFNTSSGKALMHGISATKFSLLPLRAAFHRYRAELANGWERSITSVSSAKVREWLSGLVPRIPKKGTQEDPVEFFNLLFEKTGFHLPLMEQPEGQKAKAIKDTSLIMLFPEAGKKFSDMLGDFFVGSGKKWFTESPEGFLTVAYQTAEIGKMSGGIDYPFSLELTEEQCKGADRTYEPTAFIMHHGSERESGHYTAFIKRKGRWWHANDASVTEVSEGEAIKASKQALIVHWAKVK
jgi:ubiquitin C-terminal hydrolase